MDRLSFSNDKYQFTNKRDFKKFGELDKGSLNENFNFAKKMSYTEEGHHRRNRSGGNDQRSKNQIFCDTFNGKIGEFAIYRFFLSQYIKLPYPDTRIMGEGEWDNFDFTYKNLNIGVKTTKKFGHLLLLETKDWNENGQYIPNINKGHADYDYMILVRINTKCCF